MTFEPRIKTKATEGKSGNREDFKCSLDKGNSSMNEGLKSGQTRVKVGPEGDSLVVSIEDNKRQVT